MKGYKAILEELCRTALNFPAGELQTLVAKSDEELTEEESAAIAEKLKGHYRNILTQINVTNNKALEEKFKAGQRNKAKEFEQALKETFGVDSDKEGAELISDIKEQLEKKTKGKDKNDLTDDDVKKHAAFIRMENDYKKQINQLKDDHKKEVEGIQAKAARKETFAEVSKLGLEKFEAMNPVLSDDPKKAAAQKALIIKELEAYDYQKVDGKYVPIYPQGHDKAGQRVEDEYGHSVELEKLVENVASPLFDFKKAQDRNAPHSKDGGKPGDDKDGKNQHSYKGPMPKTQSEYENMMNDSKLSIKDRMAINDHWEKQTQGAPAQ